MPHTNHDLRTRLEAMAEPAYRAFSERLQPGARRPLLGIRIPELRRMAKQAVRSGEWKEWLDETLGDDTFEEALLRGLLIGMAPLPAEEARQRLKAYIPTVDNWALCDITCSAFRPARKDTADTWEFMQPYFADTTEYGQRFAAVLSLSHYVNAEYVDMVLERLAVMRPSAYYARMGVAWALSVCFVKFPQQTLRYLTESSIEPATYRMTLQKILESRRTPEDCRALIAGMRDELNRKKRSY